MKRKTIAGLIVIVAIVAIVMFAGCIEDKTQPTAPTVTKQVGQLSVTSTPSGAEVYLDDNYVGTTPLTLSNVSVGSHLVKLAKEGYEDWTTAVDVKAGGTDSVSATLSEIDFTKPYEIAISTSLSGDYNHFLGKSILVNCPYGPDLTVKFNNKEISGIRQVEVNGSHISYFTLKLYEEELTSRKIEISGVSYGIFMIDNGAVAMGEWRVIRIKME
jgi:hypothetical protein